MEFAVFQFVPVVPPGFPNDLKGMGLPMKIKVEKSLSTSAISMSFVTRDMFLHYKVKLVMQKIF